MAVFAGTTLRLGKPFAQVKDAMDRYGPAPFDGVSFALEEETVVIMKVRQSLRSGGLFVYRCFESTISAKANHGAG